MDKKRLKKAVMSGANKSSGGMSVGELKEYAAKHYGLTHDEMEKFNRFDMVGILRRLIGLSFFDPSVLSEKEKIRREEEIRLKNAVMFGANKSSGGMTTDELKEYAAEHYGSIHDEMKNYSRSDMETILRNELLGLTLFRPRLLTEEEKIRKEEEKKQKEEKKRLVRATTMGATKSNGGMNLKELKEYAVKHYGFTHDEVKNYNRFKMERIVEYGMQGIDERLVVKEEERLRKLREERRKIIEERERKERMKRAEKAFENMVARYERDYRKKNQGIKTFTFNKDKAKKFY